MPVKISRVIKELKNIQLEIQESEFPIPENQPAMITYWMGFWESFLFHLKWVTNLQERRQIVHEFRIQDFNYQKFLGHEVPIQVRVDAIARQTAMRLNLDFSLRSDTLEIELLVFWAIR